MDQQNEQEILVKKSPKKTIFGVIGLVLAVVIISLVLRFGIDSLRGGLFGDQTKSAADAYDAKLLSMIDERMKSEEYLSLYGLSEKSDTLVHTLSGLDYTKPMSVYRLTLNETMLKSLLGGVKFSSLPENLQKDLEKGLPQSLFSYFNIRQDTNTVAATTLSSCSVVFCCDDVKENECRLYRISEDYSVAVIVSPGEKGAAVARAIIVYLPIEEDSEAAVIGAFEGFVSNAEKIG